MTMLSLFDLTGTMGAPWAKAGYTAIAVDLQPRHDLDSAGYDENGVEHWCSDILENQDWLTEVAQDAVFISAFPPCTHLAVSGACWFKIKGLPALIEALTLVNAAREICEASGAPYMIENPVSTLSTYWRKPDYYFDPFEYGGYENGEGDGYTKKTCLWTGNGFVMPEKRPIELADDWDRIQNPPPGVDRANFRSMTPPGFAQAVFEANS